MQQPGGSAGNDLAGSHKGTADHDEGHPEAIFGLGACAVSGAIIGFLFAGYVPLAAGVFVALLLGLVIGWLIWGAARREERG